MSRRPAWLSRNVLVLTGVSLAQDSASEFLYPLLPLLVVGILGAPPVVLGVIEGAAEAAAGVAKYVSGRWSDRRGRRPFITAGYGMAAVGKLLVALAWGWPLVLAGRVVDRLGKGVRGAPRDALLAADVPPDSLGRAFGFHRAGDTLGAVIGPLLGLLALTLLNGDVRAALWWAVIPAVISVGLTFLVRERRATAPPRQAEEAPAKTPLPQSFRRSVLILSLIALANFPDALILLRVSDLGFSTTQVVLAYVVFNTVYSLGSYPAGILSDRLSPATVYSLGLIAFGTCYLGLGLVNGSSTGWVWALLAIYGLFPALTDGVGKAWISSLVDDSQRGRAQGVYQSLGSGAIFTAGLWAGLLWTVGPGSGQLPLLISGTFGLVAAVGLWLGRHRISSR